jgi:hypothetical protein
MIQKAKCGCIGIVIDTERFWCLQACDSDMNETAVFTPFIRTINDSQIPFTDVSKKQEDMIVHSINALVRQGNDLDVLKDIINK